MNTNLICPTCQGMQNLNFTNYYTSRIKWITCPSCDGFGTKKIFGPKFIGMKGFDIEIQHTIEEFMEEVSIKECPTKLELALKFNIFPSATQARKNGWVAALSIGEVIKIKKRKIKIVD